MSPEQWDKVKEILDAALELPDGARADFVRHMTADRQVIAEVEALIAASGPSPTEILKPPPSSSTLAQGQIIDQRYRLERLLASGGFADAWLAADRTLHDRMVVLKVLRQQDDGWFEKAFDKELMALARIDHPGVVQPLGAGRTPGGRPYIVIQFLQGRTLSELMEVRPLPLDRIAGLVRKMGSAVAAAHAQNVYHCDLKPDNIIVQSMADGSDEPRLIDFGIARIRQAETRLHTTVHVAGTLRYMAPEQLAGRPSETTDTYALAVIAYEMITGEAPFPASNPAELIAQQHKGARRADDVRVGVSSEAGALLQRALSWNPEKRPDSLGQFTTQLAAELTAPSGVRERKVNWKWAAALSAALLAALSVGSLMFFGRAGSEKLAQGKAAVAHHRTLNVRFQPARSAAPAISNGAYVLRGDFRIEFESSELGHLYLLSESADSPRGMTILFPSPTANGGSSEIRPGVSLRIPETEWFQPDNGRQRLWLVWSSRLWQDFETAAKEAINTVDGGAIPDTVRGGLRSLVEKAPQGQIDLPRGEIRVDSSVPAVAIPILLEIRSE